jgi:hypothetical protein
MTLVGHVARMGAEKEKEKKKKNVYWLLFGNPRNYYEFLDMG